MKKILYLLIFSCSVAAQQIPNTNLENLEGTTITTSELAGKNDQPVLIAFWATWCLPCLNELSFVNDHFEEWKKKYQFDFYAVSIDDDRTIKKVATVANGKNWVFQILLDTNQDLKRALNITTIPYLIVIKNGKIIYKKNGFVKGDELAIEEIISKNQ